jgi:hypothetical protein
MLLIIFLIYFIKVRYIHPVQKIILKKTRNLCQKNKEKQSYLFNSIMTKLPFFLRNSEFDISKIKFPKLMNLFQNP